MDDLEAVLGAGKKVGRVTKTSMSDRNMVIYRQAKTTQDQDRCVHVSHTILKKKKKKKDKAS